MDKKPAPFPPIENAADYVDALLRRPYDDHEWIRIIKPGRRMRDKFTEPVRHDAGNTQAA
jgi:hypothetical protein